MYVCLSDDNFKSLDLKGSYLHIQAIQSSLYMKVKVAGAKKTEMHIPTM